MVKYHWFGICQGDCWGVSGLTLCKTWHIHWAKRVCYCLVFLVPRCLYVIWMLKMTLDAARCLGCLSMLMMTVDANGCVGCLSMHKLCLDAPRLLYWWSRWPSMQLDVLDGYWCTSCVLMYKGVHMDAQDNPWCSWMSWMSIDQGLTQWQSWHFVIRGWQ